MRQKNIYKHNNNNNHSTPRRTDKHEHGKSWWWKIIKRLGGKGNNNNNYSSGSNNNREQRRRKKHTHNGKSKIKIIFRRSLARVIYEHIPIRCVVSFRVCVCVFSLYHYLYALYFIVIPSFFFCMPHFILFCIFFFCPCYNYLILIFNASFFFRIHLPLFFDSDSWILFPLSRWCVCFRAFHYYKCNQIIVSSFARNLMIFVIVIYVPYKKYEQNGEKLFNTQHEDEKKPK